MSNFIESFQILNVDQDSSTITINEFMNGKDINNERYIVSDADEEMLIIVKFKKIINLKSIKLHSGLSDDECDDASAPKDVDIYKIANTNIDFNDVKSLKSDLSINCLNKKLMNGQNINLQNNSKNAIKFSKIKYCAIYIKSNQNDTELTYINGISFKYQEIKGLKQKNKLINNKKKRLMDKVIKQQKKLNITVASTQNNDNLSIQNENINVVMDDNKSNYKDVIDVEKLRMGIFAKYKNEYATIEALSHCWANKWFFGMSYPKGVHDIIDKWPTPKQNVDDISKLSNKDNAQKQINDQLSQHSRI